MRMTKKDLSLFSSGKSTWIKRLPACSWWKNRERMDGRKEKERIDEKREKEERWKWERWKMEHFTLMRDKFKLHCSSFLLYYYFHIQMCSQTNDFCVFKPWVYLLYNLYGLKEREKQREREEGEEEKEEISDEKRGKVEGFEPVYDSKTQLCLIHDPLRRREREKKETKRERATKGIDDGFWVLKSVPFRLRSVQRRMRIRMRNEISFMMLCSRFWSKQEMNREREEEKERKSVQIFTPQTNVQFKSILRLSVSLRVRKRRRSICHEKHKIRNDLD